MKEEENPEEENIQFENELKKLKIKAQYNGDFFQGDKNNMPPEIESQFLDHIMAFEDAHSNQEVKKIRDILGNPPLVGVDAVADRELSHELKKINDLLAAHNIVLDVIYDVPEREIYRFIIEEFMEYETEVVEVDGMVSHFTYEEFHPNDKEEMKRYAWEFIEQLFKRDFEFMDYEIASTIICQGKEIKDKEFVVNARELLEPLEALELSSCEIEDVQIESDHAVAQASLQYHVTPRQGTATRYNEKATVGFIHRLDNWYIQSITIPGLGISKDQT